MMISIFPPLHVVEQMRVVRAREKGKGGTDLLQSVHPDRALRWPCPPS